jgi:hypothetical protein
MTQRWRGLWIVLGMTLAVAAMGAAPASKVERLRIRSLTLGIGHRVFTDFYDEVTVRLNEEFRVGDSEFTGKAVEFLPDFAIGMKSKRVYSASNEPRNPAFRIVVRKDGAPHDTSWAFLDMPPHFSRRSMLAFKLLRVEFENHAPIAARRDSAATGEAHKP